MTKMTAFDVGINSSSGGDQFNDPLALRSMEMSMRDHQICFVVPAGAKIDAHTLDLPGGILVLGALRGRVVCATGSMIIAKGGEFQGSAEAADIFIEGRVTSLSEGKVCDLSKLKARGALGPPDPVTGVSAVSGGLIALSSTAAILGHLQARCWHIPRQSDLKSSVLVTIRP